MTLNLNIKPGQYRKGIAVIVGVAAMVVASGTLHGTLLLVLNAIVAAGTSAGVIAVPNAPKVQAAAQPPITTP